MTKESLQQLIERRKVKLTNRQLFWHYSALLFLSTLPILATVNLFNYFVRPAESGIRSLDQTFWEGYLFLIIPLSFYFLQVRTLSLRGLSVKLNAGSFEEVAAKAAKQLDWKIIQQSPDYLVATYPMSWRSWGEQIIIIRNGDQVLFNSIDNPKNWISIAFSGMNKRHRIMFEEQVREVLANTKIKEVAMHS